MGYLTNFIVYTLAMVGVIVIALLVFKSTTSVGGNKTSRCLKVLDTLSIGPRKTLYIISAGEEKFLIAGDVDKTSLISKLEVKAPKLEQSVSKEIEEMSQNLVMKSDYMDRNNIGIYKTQNKPYDSVMKNLAERIREGVS